ncbi:aminotransferase class I/II-fold pyridoxal phosphate-dependent enzyme [Natronosalvus rutilus]|uniref:Aminotransferase n=1 Tax=Natronosalvus rutilus TaxID=2953753 RepID=A0A9E7NDU6_9EURY|nr:aminotransferase class I/II-fold pyridoxal phosphate-dependent enzyme [Natronosalvus rutilus]UTF55145.1 aminotransferase class I/II-fold pyridoxal phosphate-dependent enzyme [Natronosalvus rutilus]
MRGVTAIHPDAIDGERRVPHGGEPDRSLLDFSANTNPRTPDGVESVYADALVSARRYPDDGYPAYRDAAGTYVGCDPSAVVPTPGGLAAIRLALEVTLEPGDLAVVPHPSFGEYAREVRLQGATPRFVPHEAVCDFTVESLQDVDLVVVCTPNNPTGNLPDRSRLEGLADRCRAAGTTLLVDEAFLGFTEQESMARREDDCVVVARSLTKLFGLPGLRAGFAVAFGPLGERLEAARRTWNLGSPAAAVGAYCMGQTAFVRDTRERVAEERERMCEALLADGRYAVAPSSAPFLLLEVDGDGGGGGAAGSVDGDGGAANPVDDLLERTREAGIVLRDARSFRGLDSHVRVAIKDREANDRLLEVLVDG